MKKYFLSFIAMLLIVSSISCVNPKTAQAADPLISVILKEEIQNVSALSFLVKGTFKDTAGKTLSSGKKYTVKVVKGELHLYLGSKLIAKGKTLTLRPSAVSINHLMTLYGKKERMYLGTMKFTVEQSKYIRPTNIVPLEEYVKGVVPGELNSSFHMHALRAQAIAARSYVMQALSVKKSVNDTPSFQRYVGYHKDYNDSIKAAYETRGKLLTYKGKVIEALYNASNGGHTETNTGAWPGVNAPKIPYFAAKVDPYDIKTSWKSSINKKQIELTGLDLKNPEKWWGKVTEKDAKLAAELKKYLTASNQTSKIIDITSVAFSKERTDGKRLKSVSFYVAYYVKSSFGKVIKDTNGQAKRYTKKVTITADQFKNALGLRSKYVTSLKSTATTYQLTIVGNGHGVGMSQSGAGAMAKKGKGFREILAFYYPYTQLSNDRMFSVPTKPLQVMGTINYEGVNIRKSPSLTGIKLGTGKLNQYITVLGKTGEWFKIRTSTLTGYIHEEYVNVHQEITYKSGITPITSGRIQSLGAPVLREKNTLYVPAVGLTKRYGMNYKISGYSIIIMNGKNKITASLSSNTATVNGKKIKLSVRPKLINKAVYVPVSFLKETEIATYYEEKAESVLWINK